VVLFESGAQQPLTQSVFSRQLAAQVVLLDRVTQVSAAQQSSVPVHA
jgi:hypothetical protein